MRNIGIDIGKGKCIVCVVDGKGNVLERASYKNTLEDAARRTGRVCTQDEKRIRRETAASSSAKTVMPSARLWAARSPRTMPGRMRIDWKHVAQDV